MSEADSRVKSIKKRNRNSLDTSSTRDEGTTVNKYHKKDYSSAPSPVISLVDYIEEEEIPLIRSEKSARRASISVATTPSATKINLVENRRKAHAQDKLDSSEQAKAPRLFRRLQKRGWDDMVIGGLSSIGLDSEKYLEYPQDYEPHLTMLNLPPVQRSRLQRDLHELNSKHKHSSTSLLSRINDTGATSTTTTMMSNDDNQSSSSSKKYIDGYDCVKCGDPVQNLPAKGRLVLCQHCMQYNY